MMQPSQRSTQSWQANFNNPFIQEDCVLSYQFSYLLLDIVNTSSIKTVLKCEIDLTLLATADVLLTARLPTDVEWLFAILR